MKKLLMIGASLVCFSLNAAACEGHLTTSTAVQTKNTLALNKATVYSWHLGKNAQEQTYLLVVLNSNALKQLRHKKNMQLSLGDEVFKKYSSIKGGFLVLNPLSTDLDESKLTQLLN
jgi:uncharacterized GH25 family protein